MRYRCTETVMARFFVDSSDVQDKSIFIRSKEDIKHIAKVLRLKEGDVLEISDSTEWEYEAEIQYIDQEVVELMIMDKQKFAREPEVRVTLFQGIPKQSKMETIVQKCVELGVYSIVPVFMDRTVVVDKGKFDKKIERWQKVSSEAVKQCRRGFIFITQSTKPFICVVLHFRKHNRVTFSRSIAHCRGCSVNGHIIINQHTFFV